MPSINFAVFCQACEEGDLRTVKELMHEVDVSHKSSLAFRLAATSGHLDIVKLLWDKSDPAAYDSYALRYAADAGHMHVVEQLLTVCDPAACNGQALRQAAEGGHLDVVKALLPHTPHFGFEALVGALVHKKMHVVDYLLPLVNLRVDPNEILRLAAEFRHDHLLDQVIDQASDLLKPQSLFKFMQGTTSEFYKKIIPFTDPSDAQKEFLLKVAMDDLERMKLLAPYITINHNKSQALYYACCGEDKRLDIVDFLYEHSDPNDVFEWMRTEGFDQSDLDFLQSYVAQKTKEELKCHLKDADQAPRPTKKM